MNTFKLSSICELVPGFAFKSQDFGDYSDKVIKIADIQPPIVNKDYLYYSLCSNNFTKYILNHIDSETAQPNISAGSVGGFEISLPSLGEQRRIVDILIAIDRKIEINKHINDNLAVYFVNLKLS